MQRPAKPAVGYLRVSTARQRDEGVSLAAQRDKVERYAELHGLALLAVHADEGLSGHRADNRPALQAALEEVCRRRGVLVVYSLSRLARSTRDAIDIADRLERAGADLALVHDRIDTGTGMGRFVFRLMASLGELERDQIAERTAAAMGHLRTQGRRISGRIPFGYRLAPDGRTVEPEEAEQRHLRRMLRWREGGRSLRWIAGELDRRRVPTRTGAAWGASSVRSVLQRARLSSGQARP